MSEVAEQEPRGRIAAVTNHLGHLVVIGLPSGGRGVVAGRPLAHRCLSEPVDFLSSVFCPDSLSTCLSTWNCSPQFSQFKKGNSSVSTGCVYSAWFTR